MALTPSGKKKTMVAQRYFSPFSDVDDSMFSTEDAMEEDIEGESPVGVGEGIERYDPLDDKQREGYKEEHQLGRKNTLTNYVFDKLKSYGYPGRRLQEFKSKFVKEKVTADGEKDVQIEIPDKKYPGKDGIADTIENEDLRDIVREISDQFELYFNGAERSDGKWVIKFTSQKLSDEDEMGEGIQKDNLEEIYGQPAKSKKGKGSTRSAFTVQEMFNQSKNSLIKNLKNIKG